MGNNMNSTMGNSTTSTVSMNGTTTSTTTVSMNTTSGASTTTMTTTTMGTGSTTTMANMTTTATPTTTTMAMTGTTTQEGDNTADTTGKFSSFFADQWFCSIKFPFAADAVIKTAHQSRFPENQSSSYMCNWAKNYQTSSQNFGWN